MAFFGLTQLGEQQYFLSNTVSHGVDLTLFSENDMQNAFDRAVGKKKNYSPDSIPAKDLSLFLRVLYEGPIIGENDLEIISNFLGNPPDNERLPRDDLITAVLFAQEKTRKALEKKDISAVENRSLELLKEKNQRNQRAKSNPRQKFVNPVTSAQDYGWNVGQTRFAIMNQEATKSFPKRASPETAFADAMAAAGNL